jgi:glucose-1-phosphate thymidylyltransferase
MRVVIPVAGAGTRLRPHTYSMPKPLLHVAGRPILSYLLDPVVRLDPEEVIFVTGYRAEQLETYVRENYSFKATFVPQDKLLGLGYALNVGVEHIIDGDLLVILGDTIVDCNLQDFMAAGDFVLGLKQVDDPHRFGIAVTENGKVVDLEEKPENPKTNLAIIGLYYFRDVEPLKTALRGLMKSGKITRGEIQLTDALQDMIRKGVEFVPYEVQEWFDCGKKETMLSTNVHLITHRNQTKALEGCVMVPPVYVHPGAKVVRSVIGPNVSISEGSVVTDSVITNSIIGSNCTIDKMILDDSLVGHDVTLKGKSQILNIGDSTEITSG